MKQIKISMTAIMLCIIFSVTQVSVLADELYQNAISDGEILLTPASEAERDSIFEHSSLKRVSGLEGKVRVKNFDVDPQSGKMCVAYYGVEGYYENGRKSWAFAYDSKGNMLTGWSIECNSRLTVSWIDGSCMRLFQRLIVRLRYMTTRAELKYAAIPVYRVKQRSTSRKGRLENRYMK